MLRIRKDDIVSVISGKDKGKSGKVLEVYPDQSRALVENLNLAKKARRRTQQNQQGGIADIEIPIHLSKLMLLCKHCNKPVRFKVSVMRDGSKIRECKKCKAAI